MERRDFLIKSALLSSGLLGAGTLSSTSRANPHRRRRHHHRNIYTVDSYCHWSSTEILDVLEAAVPIPGYQHVFRELFARMVPLTNLDARLELMDKTNVDHNVLIPLPWIESIPPNFITPQVALDAAQTINDQMAEIVRNYPDKFSAVALIPTISREDMLYEFKRSVNELGLVGGVYVCSYVTKPPDHADFIDPNSDETLYGTAAELGVPLWLHPAKPPFLGDYAGEDAPAGPGSMYSIYQTLSWLLDTSVAMVRMVFAGIFEMYPDIKIVTHHHGALIPLFSERLAGAWGGAEQPTSIQKPYIDHFKNFYCDTATQGFSPDVLKVAIDFFGEDHVLFGTDAPFDATGGTHGIESSRDSVEAIRMPTKSLKKIFGENIQRLIGSI